jgi:NADH-quinone oxidoreductase E subunit
MFGLDLDDCDRQGSGVARLNPDNVLRARDLIALYPESRSALIPILHVLQEQDGYLSEDGMAHVAELLGLTAAEVRGTASFYDMFHFEPVGKYLVAVCTNIACMLQGAYRLLEHAEEHLGVAPGATTADGLFTLEDAECLALCGNAPCLTVNWRFFGDVDLEGFDTLVEDLRAGRLDEEVPPHGTLSRVSRTVGLQADGPGPAAANGAVMAAGPTQAPVEGTDTPSDDTPVKGRKKAVKSTKATKATTAAGGDPTGDGPTEPLEYPHPPVDLATRRSTAATLSLNSAHTEGRP